MMFGAECTCVVSLQPFLYCGEPATRYEHSRAGVTKLQVWRSGENKTRAYVAAEDSTVLAVLCDAHRTGASVPIPPDAARAAPSVHFLKR